MTLWTKSLSFDVRRSTYDTLILAAGATLTQFTSLFGVSLIRSLFGSVLILTQICFSRVINQNPSWAALTHHALFEMMMLDAFFPLQKMKNENKHVNLIEAKKKLEPNPQFTFLSEKFVSFCFIGHLIQIVEMLWKIASFHFVRLFIRCECPSLMTTSGRGLSLFCHIPITASNKSKITLFFRRSISLQFTLFTAQQKIRPASVRHCKWAAGTVNRVAIK